jgi:hypothetical protein
MIGPEYESTALLALPSIKEGVSEDVGLLAWSRPFLIEQIRAQGVDVHVSRGIGALDNTGRKAKDVVRPAYDPEGNVTMHRLGTTGLDEYGVVRNILRPVEIDNITNVLNPTSIRLMARNKFEMANELYVPEGVYGREFRLFDPQSSGEAIEDILQSLPGEAIVAKPNGGKKSIGVYVGDKREVAEFLKGISTPYIIEEKLDFSTPMPGVRGLDQDEQARLDEANKTGVNKELRMFYFGNGVWDGVGRIARADETDFRDDKWLQIASDSIPHELVEKGNDIISKIQEKIGTDEIHVAFDWVYASSASRPMPRWQMMELNAAEPQLVQLRQHMDVGQRQHYKLATQIVRIAVS